MGSGVTAFDVRVTKTCTVHGPFHVNKIRKMYTIFLKKNTKYFAVTVNYVKFCFLDGAYGYLVGEEGCYICYFRFC